MLFQIVVDDVVTLVDIIGHDVVTVVVVVAVQAYRGELGWERQRQKVGHLGIVKYWKG